MEVVLAPRIFAKDGKNGILIRAHYIHYAYDCMHSPYACQPFAHSKREDGRILRFILSQEEWGKIERLVAERGKSYKTATGARKHLKSL